MNTKRAINTVILMLTICFFAGESIANNRLKSTIDFKANIVPISCIVKASENTIIFKSMIGSQLLQNRLVEPKNFNIQISSCEGVGNQAQKSKLKISGNGFFTTDNRWIFIGSNSKVRNTGVMLFQTETIPNYNSTEVKNNSEIDFSTQGGQIPVGDSLNFYAGLTCGNEDSCLLARKETGEIKALITFDFIYN